MYVTKMRAILELNLFEPLFEFERKMFRGLKELVCTNDRPVILIFLKHRIAANSLLAHSAEANHGAQARQINLLVGTEMARRVGWAPSPYLAGKAVVVWSR